MVNTPNTRSMPPFPPAPNEPYHPEKLPPNIPIPGKPESVPGKRDYKCKICGKVFSSKEELDEHMHEAHSG